MGEARPVGRLPNMNDQDAPAIARAADAARKCAELFALRGYRLVDTPLLEETELFLRKSGGTLSSRLYGFVEPGGYEVSLRPEFTAPVLRYALEVGGDDRTPRRYQYAGPVFRYAPPEDLYGSKTRQFTQVGAELIGASAPDADGEVLAMAFDGLRCLGITDFVIALGHVGLLWDILRSTDLSERTKLYLVNNIGALRDGEQGMSSVRDRANELGLVRSPSPLDPTPAEEAAENIVEGAIRRTIGPLDPNAGLRTTDEIVERLARRQKAADDPVAFDQALAVLGQLATTRGQANDALEAGAAVLRQSGCDERPLEAVQAVIDAAVNQGVPIESFYIDFGLARGISYYTGMLFDLCRPQSPDETFGGGGRYDGLPRALGASNDIPALGFAYNLEAVISASDTASSDQRGGGTLVISDGADAVPAATTAARDLRSAGQTAVQAFVADSPEDPAAYARAQGLDRVITVSADGTTRSEDVT